ncbi:ABC transporter permease subunit [Jatrophihabitans cynanchi]|uniref:ABC transporter permease subunit n=1 Tax=Jatrophihabitans cynanchi TaxID=2944128 RepID=A0ABY7K2R3_9ACTN|nr:ABC transporter permease subunit [Jatrophihabitans sp. SB3-54]WAX58290.1 ABC transporter permease subunit [Jatrophihabitans sp. SB3-54]
MGSAVDTRERVTPLEPRRRLPGRLSRRIDYLSERKFAVLLFLPAGLLVALVAVPPIAAVFGMSLFRIELLRDGPDRYVALKNFHRLVADSNFTASIPRTMLFAIGTTVLTVPLALATALLMNKAKTRYSAGLSVALLLPWAIAPIVTGFFWRFMFQPSFGVITSILRALGIVHGPVAWLQDPGKAFGIAILATAWRSAPLLALIMLGALKSIPPSLYRAAAMDGATGLQAFRAVTLPAIRTTLFISTILQIIISLQVFDLLFQLTRGGPGLETTTVAYYIYNAAFNNLSLGYSAMLALFLMAVIIVFSLAAAYLGRNRRPKVEVTDDELVDMQLHALPQSAVSALPRTDYAEPKRRRRLVPARVRRLGMGVSVVLLLIWSVGPTLWILIASLQPESAVTSSPPTPTWRLDFSHYRELFTSHEWISSFKVSFVVTIATTLITLLLGALAAYPLARLRIRGKNVIIGLLMFTYTVPALVLAIPLLLVYNHVGLTDTIQGLVIANVAFCLPLAIWLLKAIFENVPEALEKSARIDGCSRIGTLFRVTVPAASSGIAATGLLLLISVWNEFLFAVVLGNHGAVTITRRIGYINSPTGIGGEPPYTYQAAAGIVAVLPVILLVMFFHRRISSGLADSYLKG